MTARARYGPRVGPKACAGGSRIWIRRIEGRTCLFISTGTYLAIYDDDTHQLIRLTIKDTP